MSPFWSHVVLWGACLVLAALVVRAGRRAERRVAGRCVRPCCLEVS